MTKAAETTARLTAAPSERDHSQGRINSPVVLVEYGDYECPYCHQVHPVIRALQERLGDRLGYVYRHFPIRSVHSNAQLASEAAEAAASQGKFWEMHDLLYVSDSPPTRETILGYAQQIGLDIEQFTRELDEGAHNGRIREDFASGVRSGVNGTPTFFINGRRYDGAWDYESLLEEIEKPLGRRMRLLAQEFARLQASGGIVLLICTLVALLWANLPFASSYFHLWETEAGVLLGDFHLEKHLLHWVNDGLMAVFFLVVGLEIKREISVGELASPRKAALPIAAALGGMIFPALLYTLFNAGTQTAGGWGIAMATDIAFTLGIMALLGSRVPLSLRIFFTAMAIADDLGAVLVIALFYTAGINWIALLAGAVILVGLFALNRARVYAPLPYALLGIALWLAFLQSGVHATIAGVLLAMTIPTRRPPDTRALLAQAVTVLDEYDRPLPWQPAHSDSRHQSVVSTLEAVTERLLSPAQRLERDLTPWTTYLILPVFALANAGVALIGQPIQVFDPVSLGIIAGLVLGKPLGISLFSYAAVKLGIAERPADFGWRQLVATSLLAGIGFTMSLFIANAAFTDPATLESAKLAILIASIIAGGLGALLLTVGAQTYAETTGASIVEMKDIEVLPSGTK